MFTEVFTADGGAFSARRRGAVTGGAILLAFSRAGRVGLPVLLAHAWARPGSALPGVQTPSLFGARVEDCYRVHKGVTHFPFQRFTDDNELRRRGD